jgi:TonB family protein
MIQDPGSFYPWADTTLRKMIALSFVFHLVLAGALVGVSTRRNDHPVTALQVDLVTWPQTPKKAPTPPKPVVPVVKEAVKEAPAPVQPKPVVKPAPKPEPEIARKPVPSLTPKEPKPSPPVPLTAEDQPVVKEPEATPGPTEQAAVVPPSVSSVVAGVDIPDFEFPYYLRLIQGKIGSLWSPPATVSGKDSKEVVISFVLGATGKVRDVQVEKSSGNVYYDQAALRAIYMANPMPPLPKGFRDPHLKVHFSFVLAESG